METSYEKIHASVPLHELPLSLFDKLDAYIAEAKVIRQSTSVKITRLRKPVLAFVTLIDESILDVLFRARKMLGVTPISVFGMSVALSKIMAVDVSFNAVALFLDGLIYIVQHP